MFTSLNTHSTFSKMRGTASLRDLLKHAVKYRMNHLALTEVNGIWGFIRFVQFAREFDIQPIAGVNLITDYDDVILLVENQQGYENMCRIISDVHESRDVHVADLLKSRYEGLFILSHEKHALAKLMQLIPATHLFVELRPGVEERTAKGLAKQFQLEIVATGDVYFISPEDQPAHKVLRTIEHNTTLTAIDPVEVKGEAHYFRSEKEMATLFPNSLDAINNAQYLAERCKTDWQFLNTIFPNMDLKNTREASRKLRKLVYAGAEKRYGRLKMRNPIENRDLKIVNSEHRITNNNSSASSAVKKTHQPGTCYHHRKRICPLFSGSVGHCQADQCHHRQRLRSRIHCELLPVHYPGRSP